MKDDFLLTTPLAGKLFHECAEKLPVIDYHNHLNIRDFAKEKSYRNIAELWLLSDPYKHRAMRICGVAEKYITGNAKEIDKFKAWMDVLPRLIGNPLYDWSILEMKRVFEIELKPGSTNADYVWNQVNGRLSQPQYSAAGLLEQFNVEYAAPCAQLTDDISEFGELKGLAPSLRGDNAADITAETVRGLEQIAGRPIKSLDDYFGEVSRRISAFEQAGCRFSDHALDNGFVYYPDDGQNGKRFQEILKGETLEEEDKKRLASGILRFLAGEYAARGWTMQLHIGAERFTSSRLRAIAGPAGGFAGIGNCCDVSSITRMLDDFEKNAAGMPEIILFTLNPADNAVMSVLSGSYSQDGVVGKIQQGPAWWWCDHLYGMREVFESISAFGVLSAFIGMTTDSRSILSFVRHEYFRRALCGWIGEKASRGEMEASEEALMRLVEDVCYNNTKRRVFGNTSVFRT